MTATGPADPEGDALRRIPASRWWAVPAALVAAALGYLVAPDSWSPGPGVVAVTVAEAGSIEVDVDLGSTERFERTVPTGTGDATVIAPAGLPLDAPIELTVGVVGRELAPDEVSIELIRADGRREDVLSVSTDDGQVTAVRRPPVDSGIVIALLAAVVVLWVSEIVPLFVTALAVPMVLAAAGVEDAVDALSPFFDPIIVLFFAGFVMAEVMRRVGLERWAAVAIVARAGTAPVRLYAALLASSAFLSMWMSNTAAAMVLIPVALAVTEPFEHDGYRRAAILGIAYAATIGGVASAIGTPANQLAIRFAEELTGRRISFIEWFGFGLPVVSIFLPVLGWYLWRVSRVQVDRTLFAETRAAAIEQQRALGRFDRDQLHVLSVFGIVMALWLTQGWHDLNTGIVALGGAVVLFATGRAEPVDLGRISWPTLLTFGGGLSLGVAMVDSGTADWLVTRLDGLEGSPTIVGLAAAATLALALSTVASNTASAATLIPLAIPLAGLLGLDPVVVVVTVAIATSIDFALVIGTPPTMIAYGTGYFTARQVLRTGLPLDLVGLAILVCVATLVWPALWLV